MAKRFFSMMVLLASMAITVSAETLTEVEEVQATQEKASIELPAWVKNIKFSGYGMLQYQGEDKNNSHSNTFNLRLARFILDGKIGDFDWRAQIQGTNATGPGQPTVQLVDLYAEWRRYPEFKIRAGQFKRAFTFENPTHPITQGWKAYADVINRLSGFGDRTCEPSSGGRDIGIQFAGDLFPNANGRRLFHYQIGIYNGEGVNMKDQDNRKDIIGGIWVMPIAGMRIGAFGWTGSRAGVGEKNRYALSGEYTQDDWTFRTEYIHSQGWNSNFTSDKADGIYALCIAPIQKNKFHVKARYDLYREAKEWGRAKTFYEVGADYMFTKNLQINLEYARVNDRSLEKSDYNMVDVELDFRF